MSLKLSNLYEDGDVFCEKCQEPIKDGCDNCILDYDLLYHSKCFDEKCKEYFQ